MVSTTVGLAWAIDLVHLLYCSFGMVSILALERLQLVGASETCL
jgi:hypothetical protein